jgi:hypothetical protein
MADNYRAIALSNDFRRIFERLVGARLSTWIQRHDATGRMQFGFKRGAGTIEAIFVLRTVLFHITRVLSRPAYSVFVDIRKAFPSTSRARVLEIFRRNNVPAKITQSMAALLGGSTSRLRVNNRLTDPITVTSGTPEGSINSPDIFNVLYAEIFKKLGVCELPEDLSTLDPEAVYYIVFADDVSFFGMNLQNISTAVSDFKRECEPNDLEVNAGKSKWMCFVPPGDSTVQVERDEWEFRVDSELIEQVDEFPYLGYRLDTALTDDLHVKMVNDRMLKAARAVGQIMRDLKCSSLLSLRRYFLSLVSSQLYGLIFIDSNLLNYELAAGVFLKTALGLAASFPSAAAMSILGVRPIEIFQQEQRIKFLIKVESKTESPVFDCLVHDRGVLFRVHVGLNSLLGNVLASLDAPRTLDYRIHYSSIIKAVEGRAIERLRAEVLVAAGRAFWTEMAPEGLLQHDLRSVLSSLPYEQLRVSVLFLSDTLRWSSRIRSRFCDVCKRPFNIEHLFSCQQDFLPSRGWEVFMSLCLAKAWADLIECIFDVLQRWALSSSLFSPDLRVTALEFEPFAQPMSEFNPFRFSL